MKMNGIKKNIQFVWYMYKNMFSNAISRIYIKELKKLNGYLFDNSYIIFAERLLYVMISAMVTSTFRLKNKLTLSL